MKSKKKFVLAGLMLLATVLVLPLVGCDTGSGGGSVAQKPATNTPGGGTDGNGEEYTVTVVSDGIRIDGGELLPKTSEVQVLSEAVNLSSLYVEDSEGKSVSQIFVENRVDSIQPFVMGQYEVTQQLYEAVMGSNPSAYTSDVAAGETQELRPVEQVSWDDAVEFCNKLSQLMGLEPVYSRTGIWWNPIGCNWNANGYRLPTEAEWELAARGGNPEAEAWKYTYAGTNEESTLGDYAWYLDNSSEKPHQVGTKAANSLGLYDMSGNVAEWCWDLHDNISASTPSFGYVGPRSSDRVIRGGGLVDANYCTVSNRIDSAPNSRGSELGFRLVRSAN